MGSEFVFLGFVCEKYSKLNFVPKSKFLNSASLLSSLLSFWGGGGWPPEWSGPRTPRTALNPNENNKWDLDPMRFTEPIKVKILKTNFFFKA